MSDEETVTLIKAGIDVRDNMERLYNQCYGYIRKVASRYIEIAEIEDLMQEGYIALNNAVYDFDISGEQRFVSWLFIRLLRQFENYCLGNKKGVVNNRRYNTFIVRYNKLKRHFNVIYNRDPDMKECVAYLRMSIDMIEKIKKAAYYDNTVSTDMTISGEDNDGFSLGMTLPSNANVEDEVIDKTMQEDLKTGLWKIVKDNVTDNEYGVVRAVYIFNMPFEKYASQYGTTRYEVTNNYYNAMSKLRTQKIRKRIADRFEINYTQAFRAGLSRFKNNKFTSSTEEIAIKNIENEISYITYVLTAVKDGIDMLTPAQINLAHTHGLLNDDFEICVKWEIPKHGIAAKQIEQYDLSGKFIKIWMSVQEAAEYIGTTVDGIYRCSIGQRKSSGGFIWKKIDIKEVGLRYD